MRNYNDAQLSAFLREVDRHLEDPCSAVVIGGAVLSLAYAVKYATRDIDVLSAEAPFWDAVRLARETSPEPVPTNATRVADLPWNYEDRLEVLHVDGLAKLEVLKPEKHDLALMKASRGSRHDIDGLLAAHAVDPLEFDTLVERWREMRYVVGDLRRIRNNVVVLISLAFDEARAEEAEVILERLHRDVGDP